MNVARSAGLSCLAALAAAAAVQAAGLPPPGTKIAFIGDQDDDSESEAVLQLILDEGAEAIVHAGDFDYGDRPASWGTMLDDMLGPCFPYFAVLGNHDIVPFYTASGYQDRLEARMNCAGIPWTGDLAVRSSHYWRGIFFVMSAPGVFADTGDAVDAPYVRQKLAADTSAWRISVWHLLMETLQVGGKDDESGWGVYEESRRAGAIVATGHEHSYGRTHALSSFPNRTIASTSNTIALRRDKPATAADEGVSFAFYSGLGGRSIRDQERCLPATPPYGCPEWASVYASNQGANFGALFGEFNWNGDPCLAHFYFKDVDGVVADEFFVRTAQGPCAPCRIDLNADGVIGDFEMLAVVSAWGRCTTGCSADMDASGFVDAQDLTIVVSRWGPCRAAPAAPSPTPIILSR
jgi:hypothetical protein